MALLLLREPVLCAIICSLLCVCLGVLSLFMELVFSKVL